MENLRQGLSFKEDSIDGTADEVGLAYRQESSEKSRENR